MEAYVALVLREQGTLGLFWRGVATDRSPFIVRLLLEVAGLSHFLLLVWGVLAVAEATWKGASRHSCLATRFRYAIIALGVCIWYEALRIYDPQNFGVIGAF